MISSSQWPLPDNTQHSQQTNVHAAGGIRTHNLSRRAAVDLRLRPRSYWGRLWDLYKTHKYLLLADKVTTRIYKVKLVWSKLENNWHGDREEKNSHPPGQWPCLYGIPWRVTHQPTDDKYGTDGANNRQWRSTDGSCRWTSVGTGSSNVFGKANEILLCVRVCVCVCVSLYIFNKTAESIIAKPPRTTDKTDCCLCILQNNNRVRPPHGESDPSFLSRTSFTFGSHIFFTENQRVFRRSFMFRRSGRLSSKAISLIWNITTFSKHSPFPSSG